MQIPRPEARISNLEKQTILLGARIEELAADTDENFRSLKQDIKQLSGDIDLGFRQAHAYIDENMATKDDVSKLESRFDKLESRFDKLEATQVEQGQKLDQIIALMQQKQPDK